MSNLLFVCTYDVVLIVVVVHIYICTCSVCFTAYVHTYIPTYMKMLNDFSLNVTGPEKTGLIYMT